MSTTALDALDRARTVIFLTVSPLEQHGPHLPLGVDAFAGRHLAEALAGLLVERRPGWTAVLAPTIYAGTFTFHSPGTISLRQRVVRDLVEDYGRGLARAGFRFILVANGHAGPGHLVALEEAAARVSRRHRVTMASITGDLAWGVLRGRFLDRIEAALGRALTASERTALTDDAHAGFWETSVMLRLRPDLVDAGFRELPAARYSLLAKLRPNFPLRDGGRGYVGSPAVADPRFADAAGEVLLGEALGLVEGLLDGRVRPAAFRSPFYAIPFFRTNFWPAAGVIAAAVALGALLRSRRDGAGGGGTREGGSP